jgi:hypothetical protein
LWVALASTVASLPPKVGHALMVAIFMPGTCASIPNFARPSTLRLASSRRQGLPISRKSVGALSITSAGMGRYLLPAEERDTVELSIRRRMLDAHLIKVDPQLFGQEKRCAGIDRLPHLGIRHDEAHEAVGADPDEGVRRKWRSAIGDSSCGILGLLPRVDRGKASRGP